MKPIYSPGYGPFDDRFRLRAVAISEIIGYKRADKYCKCSESAIRTWKKVYHNGVIRVEVERV